MIRRGHTPNLIVTSLAFDNSTTLPRLFGPAFIMCTRLQLLVLTMLFGLSTTPSTITVATADHATDTTHVIPFFPSASDPLGRQGFARIVNLSAESGTVSISIFDDGGRTQPPIRLNLDSLHTVHFNSSDLEDGNTDKGLSQGVGRPSQGDWRLELTSDLTIKVLSYIRTGDGFVTAMHDVARREGRKHQIWFFNPGSNLSQESLLRLVNPSDLEASITIFGVDDLGSSSGLVRLNVPPWGARTLRASELEEGGGELEGALGDGIGKWRLEIRADRPIQAMSLLATPTGHLTNLASSPDFVTATTFFRLWLMEIRFDSAQPPLDIEHTKNIVIKVLSDLGFSENDYEIVTEDEGGRAYVADLSSYADAVIEEDSSSPATIGFLDYLKERLDGEQHRIGDIDGFRYDEMAHDPTSGELFLGITTRWPDEKFHGSFARLQRMTFKTICTSQGFATCSDREDCIGHELGHAFGLSHAVHNWYGYDPQPEHVRWIRGAASCTPRDIEWTRDEPHTGLHRTTGTSGATIVTVDE